jgi:ribonuclease III
MRAAIVNESRLAEIAARLGVGDAMRLGRGEERTGGRAKASLLANALEAAFAAVYLDAGVTRACEVVLAMVASTLDHVVSTASAQRDEKTVLQELIQARHNVTPRYEVTDTQGPDHDRVWHVEVRAGEVLRAKGQGRSKKIAEQEAARNALRALDEPNASPDAPLAPAVEGDASLASSGGP